MEYARYLQSPSRKRELWYLVPSSLTFAPRSNNRRTCFHQFCARADPILLATPYYLVGT